MSPVGAIFVSFPPKTGTNMLHPRPPAIVELVHILFLFSLLHVPCVCVFFFSLYGGSGLRCQTRLSPLMFSFPYYLDDHERDCPPRRVAVCGLATNRYIEYKKQQRTTIYYIPGNT